MCYFSRLSNMRSGCLDVTFPCIVKFPYMYSVGYVAHWLDDLGIEPLPTSISEGGCPLSYSRVQGDL